MPFDRTRYPVDWKAISLRIRERDGQRCKWCGVPNGAYIRRNPANKVEYWHVTDKETRPAWADQAPLVQVVLTVAHLDHDTTNNDDSNLAALCQLHHQRHDIQQHVTNAAATRRRRKIEAGQVEIEL